MKLSICVPTYNRPKEMNRLIREFLERDLDLDVELCISDNGNFTLPYHYKAVRYRKNKENIGFDRNLYEALKMGRGDWLWMMGDDDLPIDITELVKNLDTKHDFILMGYGDVHIPNYFMTTFLIRRSVLRNLDCKQLQRGFDTLYFHAWLQVLLFMEGKKCLILPKFYYKSGFNGRVSFSKELKHYVPWIYFRYQCFRLALEKKKLRLFFLTKLFTSFFYFPVLSLRHIIMNVTNKDHVNNILEVKRVVKT